MKKLYCSQLPSDLGTILITSTDKGVCRICLPGATKEEWEKWGEVILVAGEGKNRQVARQLRQYLQGKRRSFSCSLDIKGSFFQKRVWQEVARIPFGKTATYQDIARRIGKPKAARAVGGAVGSNPIPIIIPCHRVIGKDGSLIGFGGGLDLKRKLLGREGIFIPK